MKESSQLIQDWINGLIFTDYFSSLVFLSYPVQPFHLLFQLRHLRLHVSLHFLHFVIQKVFDVNLPVLKVFFF